MGSRLPLLVVSLLYLFLFIFLMVLLSVSWFYLMVLLSVSWLYFMVLSVASWFYCSVLVPRFYFYTEISVCIFIIHSARVDYVLSLLRTSFKSKKKLQNACYTNPHNFIFLDSFPQNISAKQHLGVAFEILPTESSDTFDEPWQSLSSANARHVTWIVKKPWVIPNKSRVTGLFQKM